jgi:hypothetical protein
MYSENEKPQKTKIFRTYLEFVDSSRFFTTPFSWLYLIVALAFLALPIAVLAKGIQFEVFSYEGKIVFLFILLLIASIAAAIVAFVVAWDGKKKDNVDKITVELIIDSLADLQGLIIKALAHFLAVFGFFAGLFSLIFGGDDLLSEFALPYGGAMVMLGSLLGGYALVWVSRLYKFLFAKIARIIVHVIVQVFKFVVLHSIAIIYNFIAHIIRQLFDYVFVLIQAIVDYIVNGLRVIIALVARLGRFLLAYACSPFKNKEYNNANITYND